MFASFVYVREKLYNVLFKLENKGLGSEKNMKENYLYW